MLEFKNITKSYNESKRKNIALDDISFKLPEKGFISIIGKSGSGKTTILNILSGIIKPTSGTYLIDNTDSSSLTNEDWDNIRSEYFSYVFQDNNLINSLTVYENLSILLLNHPNYDEKDIDKCLEKLDILSLRNEKVSNLSGGEKERVALARALFKKSKVILADEVTASLDEENSINVFKTLKEVSKEVLVIVVTHDTDLAMEYSDSYIKMNYGKIKETTIEEVKDNTNELKIKSSNMPNKNINKFKNMVFRGFRWQSVFSIIINSIVLILMIFTLHLLFFNKYDYVYNDTKGSDNYSLLNNGNMRPFESTVKLPTVYDKYDMNLCVDSFAFEDYPVFGYQIIDDNIEDDLLYIPSDLISNIKETYSNVYKINNDEINIKGNVFKFKELHFNKIFDSSYYNFIVKTIKGNRKTMQKLTKSFMLLDAGKIDDVACAFTSLPNFENKLIKEGSINLELNEVAISNGDLEIFYNVGDTINILGEDYIIKCKIGTNGAKSFNSSIKQTIYFNPLKFKTFTDEINVSYETYDRLYEIHFRSKEELKNYLEVEKDISFPNGEIISFNNDYIEMHCSVANSIINGWLPMGYILLGMALIILLLYSAFSQKTIRKTQSYKLGIIYFLGFNKKDTYKAYNLNNMINNLIAFVVSIVFATIFIILFDISMVISIDLNWYIIRINPLLYLLAFIVILLFTSLLISNTLRGMYKKSLNKLLIKE